MSRSGILTGMQHLRELTDKLPFPAALVAPSVAGGVVEYKVEKGTSLAWNLLNTADISAARWFNSRGTVFNGHSHEQTEWLIVYRGEMLLKINGKEQRLKPSQGVMLKPYTEHSATFDCDCWYLAITIPRCDDWPG